MYTVLKTYDDTLSINATIAAEFMASNNTSPAETVTVENHFGTFSFTEDDMVTIQQGLIGFADYTQFGLAPLQSTGKDNRFRLLQSLDNAHLSFVVFPTTADSALLDKPDVADICSQFGISRDHLVLLHIATIRDASNGQPAMTLNLKAPIIVDTAKQTAVQYVLPSNKYAIQHPIAA